MKTSWTNQKLNKSVDQTISQNVFIRFTRYRKLSNIIAYYKGIGMVKPDYVLSY